MAWLIEHLWMIATIVGIMGAVCIVYAVIVMTVSGEYGGIPPLLYTGIILSIISLAAACFVYSREKKEKVKKEAK